MSASRDLSILAVAAVLVVGCADRAVVVDEADRSGHLFDKPFPSDHLLTAAGTVDLSAFPDAGTNIGTTFVRGWARQAGETVHGWSHLAPIGLRFDRAVEVPSELQGADDDPVRLISLDSGHRPALRTRFVADPAGDPFLARNLLLVQPQPWDPLNSGETYELHLDRKLADTDGPVTTFTVQDSMGQLAQLREAADAFIDADPTLLDALGLKQVVGLRFEAGQTPSGRDSVQLIATYADDTTEVTYLGARDGFEAFDVDLSDDPMEVWAATIHTVAFQDLDDQPYAQPGVGFLSDFDRSDGWIHFDASGTLTSTPTAEPMRIVVLVPRTGTPTGVLTWDHGTGGNAYNAVQRVVSADRAGPLRAAFADAGITVVSRDQPLYGQRYPLVDQGFGKSIGFYNIGNLPAWRDNQRQGGIDMHVLQRFSHEVLPGLFPGRVATDRVGAFGHSLGSVTAHIGLAAQQGDYVDHALMSGAGGDFTYYATDTGLLGSDNDVVGLLGPLVGVELPDDPTGSQAVGALLGVPENAWDGVDGLHPGLGLFQLIMDPSDPMVLAPAQATPETVVMGQGDLQVPNFTTEWLVQGTPQSTLVPCAPTSDYDPHQCLFREEAGITALQAYLSGL